MHPLRHIDALSHPLVQLLHQQFQTIIHVRLQILQRIHRIRPRHHLPMPSMRLLILSREQIYLPSSPKDAIPIRLREHTAAHRIDLADCFGGADGDFIGRDPHDRTVSLVQGHDDAVPGLGAGGADVPPVRQGSEERTWYTGEGVEEALVMDV